MSATSSLLSRFAALLLVLALAAASAPALAEDKKDAKPPPPNLEPTAEMKPDVAARYREAVKAFEKARDADEDSIARMEAAIKDLKAVEKAAPRFAPPLYYLGIAYQITAEFEKARGVLKRALDVNPKFHEAMVELGDTYLWLKQPEKAIAEYERALATKADYAPAYRQRAFWRMTEKGDFKAALDDATKGLTLDPEDKGLEALREMAEREVEGPGWARTFVCETEHYRISTPVSQEFADELGKHAELIHRLYTKIFPKIDKMKRKFPIVVYADRAEYRKNGGPEGAGGHYSPMIRKLELFRYGKADDTYLVLYHEGMHQFLHEYLEDAPQWFDEGLGDFFGPSRYVFEEKKGKIVSEGMEIRPNPWRLELIQASIRRGQVRPWRQLMLMSHRELYNPQWISIHYAQSWSIIYFLCQYGADQGDRKYFVLLQNYFKALRRGEGQESAFESAFGKVDMPKLEQEWKDFILKLR